MQGDELAITSGGDAETDHSFGIDSSMELSPRRKPRILSQWSGRPLGRAIFRRIAEAAYRWLRISFFCLFFAISSSTTRVSRSDLDRTFTSWKKFRRESFSSNVAISECSPVAIRALSCARLGDKTEEQDGRGHAQHVTLQLRRNSDNR